MNADGSEQTSLGVSGAFPDWGTSPPEPDCSDGLDNDGDGKIDFPDDPGCVGPEGEDERDRKGAFSCRATALRAAGGETAVANPPNEPCADDFEEVQGVHVLGPPDTIEANTLTASTDSRPDDPAGILPASGDHAEAEAAVQKVVIRRGPTSITAWVVRAEADVTCRGTPLAPVLSASSSIAALRIFGAPVPVGSGSLDIPLGSATLRLNHTTTGSNEIVQRALWLDTGDPAQDVIVAEARADYSENPCA